MDKHCPVCTEPIILPYGDKDSEILFIGSEPTDDEVKYKRPFTGTVISIFKKELFRSAKLDLLSTRQVLLGIHQKMKKDCYKVSSSIVEEELKGKKKIILVGADAVMFFSGLSIDNVNGLDITDEVFSYTSLEIPEDAEFYALCTPNMVYRSLGEFRFGINGLGEWLHG